jgi:FkbM family methyltransferase
MTITPLHLDLNKLLKTKTPLVICDIGASPTDPTPSIEDLINNTNSILYGFEPNEDEFNKLKQSEKKIYFNYGIGNGNNQILNICATPGMSSILEPNYEYLNLFHGMSEWAKIIKKKLIKTKKLDEVNFGKKINFFKIDVQGYESEIINNGKIKIKESLVVQLETSPIPLYKNEKTFSHICNQLENLDFELHMFSNIHTRYFKPFVPTNSTYSGLHHLFQLDCIFIKKLSSISNLNIEELKKFILISLYSLKSYDLTLLLLNKLSNLTQINYSNQFKDFLKDKIMVKKY